MMTTIRLDWRDLHFARFDLKDFLRFPFLVLLRRCDDTFSAFGENSARKFRTHAECKLAFNIVRAGQPDDDEIEIIRKNFHD